MNDKIISQAVPRELDSLGAPFSYVEDKNKLNKYFKYFSYIVVKYGNLLNTLVCNYNFRLKWY